MIAGVRIGEISDLTIEGNFARADLVMLDDTNIPVDSWITKRAESAFGDSYLEIIPSGTEAGTPTSRRLKSGEQITHVIEGGSTDTVLRSISRGMPKVNRGLDTLHDFALSSRKWTEGPLEDSLLRADQWLQEGHIESPLDAADRAMTRLESGTTSAADAVASAKPNVDKTFDRIDDAISSARTRMADVKSGLHDGLANARDGIDRIDPTLAQMQDIVASIDEGRGDDYKGTLGRLVNNGDLADTLEDGTSSLASAAPSLDPFRSWIGFRTEWNIFAGEPTFYVTAEMQAHNDKFYLIELAKSAQGGIPSDQLHDVIDAQTYNRYTQIQENLKFTAQLGKRLGPLQLRGGLKESVFGVGADLLLNRGALRFSADVFEGSLEHVPVVKLTAAYEIVHTLYLIGGVNDALDHPGYLNIEAGNSAEPTYFNSVRYGRDYFLGATLQFTDADLANLLRIYGTLLIGLAL
jgi:phospholipid/cholesterol/gamma-HCH transport system substrate-binding protein